jgi:uncharacterized protein
MPGIVLSEEPKQENILVRDDGGGFAEKRISARRCIVSGNVLPKEALIRFVLGPDNRLVPDISVKLPGKGIYVTAQRLYIEKALATKAFHKKLKKPVIADQELAGFIEICLKKYALSLLSMAKKSGQITTGYEKVSAVKRKEEAVIIRASDSAAEIKEKDHKQKSISDVINIFTNEELSLALGGNNIMYAALRKGSLSDKFVTSVNRIIRYSTL